MTPEDLDEWIENYVSGSMSQEDKLEFEKQVQAHPEWREEIRFNQNFIGALKNGDFRKKLHLINSTQNNYKENTLVKKRIIPIQLKWVAAIVLVISLILFFSRESKTALHEKLYMAYMQVPASLSPDLAPNRSIQNDSVYLNAEDSILIRADQFYLQNNLVEVLHTLESVPDELITERIKFQTGLVYLISGQAQSAISLFSDIQSYNPSELHWYKGLAYLKLQQLDLAKSSFEKVDINNRWYIKSRELLNYL